MGYGSIEALETGALMRNREMSSLLKLVEIWTEGLKYHKHKT